MGEHSALLLTGVPGVGKTTVVRRVADELTKRKRRIAGFTTEEIRSGKERAGFRIETFDGRSAVLAHVSIRSEHRVSRYGVDIAALDAIVEEALAPSSRADVFLVDEIGRMECFSRRFVAAIEALLDSKRLLVATVALRGGGLIEAVKRRPDVELWSVTKSNREELPERVGEWISVREGGGARPGTR
ncbi:MAG TPA: NTPase [Thermoanaerobaculia bacterium]|nr:NTPase [Thermoanaerobaculia bacterium]